jgi:hypothetical protein
MGFAMEAVNPYLIVGKKIEWLKGLDVTESSLGHQASLTATEIES